jgi:flavin-dependent dehydrogenase
LLDAVVASNSPAIGTLAFDMGTFVLQGHSPVIDGIGVHYCVRRTILDKILLDAAVSSGVEVREGFTVDELIVNDGTVVGIAGHSRGSSPVREKARVVVGADGLALSCGAECERG